MASSLTDPSPLQTRYATLPEQFLSSLASTNWFNETIDRGRYSEDYELVCPYYRVGCNSSCRRSTLEKHLQEECYFAQQMKLLDAANLVGSSGGGGGGGGDNGNSGDFSPDDYEIVCPYAFMGCTYVPPPAHDDTPSLTHINTFSPTTTPLCTYVPPPAHDDTPSHPHHTHPLSPPQY